MDTTREPVVICDYKRTKPPKFWLFLDSIIIMYKNLFQRADVPLTKYQEKNGKFGGKKMHRRSINHEPDHGSFEYSFFFKIKCVAFLPVSISWKTVLKCSQNLLRGSFDSNMPWVTFTITHSLRFASSKLVK